MRQPRRIIFIALAGIFLAGFAWFLLKPREPSYQGKALNAWLEDAVASGVYELPEANPEAVNAIRQIGTKAIPTLLKFAAAKGTRMMKFLQMLEQKQSLIHFHHRSPDELQTFAYCGFYFLGPDAKPAVPGLTALLKDDDSQVRWTAAECLGLFGPAAQAAVPELIKEFERQNSNTYVRLGAAYALGEIGPPASASIPALTAALTNQSSWNRAKAQAALIKVQAASLSPFIDQLRDTSNPTNWAYAVWVVVNSGTNAGPAVPVLLSALNHTNLQVWALYGLRQIHQQPELCVPVLFPLLESTNASVRYGSIRALRRFGNAAKPAAPALIRCLNDSESSVRQAATNALRAIDPEAAVKAGVK